MHHLIQKIAEVGMIIFGIIVVPLGGLGFAAGILEHYETSRYFLAGFMISLSLFGMCFLCAMFSLGKEK